jgi:hypothetical protein
MLAAEWTTGLTGEQAEVTRTEEEAGTRLPCWPSWAKAPPVMALLAPPRACPYRCASSLLHFKDFHLPESGTG